MKIIQGWVAQNSVTQSWKLLPLAWRSLIVVCIALGIFFRFAHLDSKVYQYDETFTSLRISGFTEAAAVETLSGAGLISPAEIQRFQRSNSEHPLSDTLKGLAIEEPQLTPLYFGLVRLWADGLSQWGSSITVVRSFSAVLGLLAVPGIGWLCWELFESSEVGWMAIALYAVSPFQVLYAQEARPPIAWTVATLLLSILLLRALRQSSNGSWGGYAIALALSLYTFLFSGLVIIGQALYVITVRRLQTPIAYLSSLGVGVAVFLPWLIQIFLNFHQVAEVTTWTSRGKLSLTQYGLSWLYTMSLGFFDGNREALPDAIKALKLGFRLIDFGVFALVAYGFYILWRKTPIRTWLFVLMLTGIPAIGLALPDVFWGGVRSITPRYLVPCYLGSQLAIAHLLVYQLQTLKKDWQLRVWQGIAVMMLSAGVLSCVAITQSPIWWNKIIGNHNPAIAQIINQVDHPLVISDAGMGDIFSLSYYLDSKVRLLVRPQCYACQSGESADRPYLPQIPDGSEAFLFNPRPSAAWMKAFRQQRQYRAEVVSAGYDRWLWKLSQWKN